MAELTGMQMFEQFFASSPFPALVGLSLDEIEEDRAVMSLAPPPPPDRRVVK